MTLAHSGLNPYPIAAKRKPSLGSRIRKILRNFRWRCALGLSKAAFYLAKGGGRPYQPVEIAGRRFANVRDSDGRWQAIAQTLRAYSARNVLDIGCAEGWFIRRAAADLNCFAVGIEASDRVAVGEFSRLHDRIERVAAIRSFVSASDLAALPKFDAVICMSVVHHIIRAHGLAAAHEFVRALAARVEKVLIFEIGTADESAWTEHLLELGQGQEVFVRELLARCGLTNIQAIAGSAAYHREVQRLLFSAEPASDADGVAAKSLRRA